MNRTVKTMIYCALFAALTAVCSQLAIPIQPVPINLALLSVYIAGGLLGGGMGAASQAVFLLIGAVGVPGCRRLSAPRAATLSVTLRRRLLRA